MKILKSKYQLNRKKPFTFSFYMFSIRAVEPLDVYSVPLYMRRYGQNSVVHGRRRSLTRQHGCDGKRNWPLAVAVESLVKACRRFYGDTAKASRSRTTQACILASCPAQLFNQKPAYFTRTSPTGLSASSIVDLERTLVRNPEIEARRTLPLTG